MFPEHPTRHSIYSLGGPALECKNCIFPAGDQHLEDVKKRRAKNTEQHSKRDFTLTGAQQHDLTLDEGHQAIPDVRVLVHVPVNVPFPVPAHARGKGRNVDRDMDKHKDIGNCLVALVKSCC